MNKLEKCPFCGSEAVMNYIEPHTHVIATFMPDYPGGAFIECTGCTAGISGETKEEAIAAWNRRADKAELERYRQAEGRMMVLPCKLGNTAFIIVDNKVAEIFVTSFRIDQYGGAGVDISPKYAEGNLTYNIPTKIPIGKLLLAREEAEAALRREVAE